jgi:hypothetical protein
MASHTRAGHPRAEEVQVEALENYTSVVAVLTVALLLVAAGLGKRQLTWKAKPARLYWRRGR